MSVMQLQEHEKSPVSKKEEKYDRLKLVEWCKRTDFLPEAYYASYKIGAEWIDEQKV